MSAVALTGRDTIKINGRILDGLCDQDAAVLEFPNDLMNAKTGKNGNSIYAFNYTGLQTEVTLRIVRGSADDKYLNNLLALMKNNPPGFTLMTGEFTKVLGNGQGGITSDTYIMSGGVFKKNPGVKENTEGDTEGAIVIYTLTFTNSPRTMG